MGYVPGVVLVPTFQVQVTLPSAPVVLVSKPAALLGPDLYVTVMEYCVCGFPWIVTLAVSPAETVSVKLTTASLFPGAGAGFGFGAGAGEGLGAGDGSGAGRGAKDGSGSGILGGLDQNLEGF